MRIVFFVLTFMLFFSCAQYRAHQKILKSTDPEFKYNQATKYYDSKDYVRSLPLFEELLTFYRGSEKAEDIYYKYIYCNYFLSDYIATTFHANNFASKFILSSKNEELAFLSAYCYYLQSPRYNLDQTKTYEAIDQLQLFIKSFPSSDSLSRVNNLIFSLNNKLEKKHYEIAKLYYETSKFQPAIYAIDNFLASFPETVYLENINFIQIKSYYELGRNSVEEKKQQRVKEAIFACDNFLIAFPEGEYTEQVNTIYEKLKNIQNGL